MTVFSEQGNRTPDYNIFTRKKGRNIRKNSQMLEANDVKILRKIVGKTKIDRIGSQQIRESCGIQPINELEERRRGELDKHVTRMLRD